MNHSLPVDLPLTRLLQVLPQSLSEVFQLEFQLLFPSPASWGKVSDLLSVCLATTSPLNLPAIHTTVSALYVEQPDTWAEFLQVQQPQVSKKIFE